MKNTELRKIIKQLVKESLAEIFAEMNFEAIVEGALKKNLGNIPKTPQIQPKKKSSYSIKDVYETNTRVENHQPQPSNTVSAEEKRRIILERMGVNDNMWKNIYSDTASSNNPILESDDKSGPEYVSEGVLEKTGLMKDYSKYIGTDSEIQNNEKEWEKLREKRKKILESVVKRAV